MLAFVALGSNLGSHSERYQGDPRRTVLLAMDALGGLVGAREMARSSLYRSDPVDASGPDFINAVVALNSSQCAPQLLQQLLQLELQFGRVRPFPNAPRSLDLDLVLYGDARINSPALTLPHPRLWQRAFVVLPLAEIAPDRVSQAARQAIGGQRIRKELSLT